MFAFYNALTLRTATQELFVGHLRKQRDRSSSRFAMRSAPDSGGDETTRHDAAQIDQKIGTDVFGLNPMLNAEPRRDANCQSAKGADGRPLRSDRHQFVFDEFAAFHVTPAFQLYRFGLRRRGFQWARIVWRWHWLRR